MKLATLVIIKKNSYVLLGLKKLGEIGAGTINAPGGKVDPGESLIECAVREIDEEIGVQLDPAHLAKTAVITFHAGNVPDFEVHVFCTETFSGEPIETDDMIPEWYPVDDLPLDRMLESDKVWFARAVRGERFCANVYYRERATDYERIEFLPWQDE